MNIKHAQVSQVTKTDNGFLLPPVIVIKRHYHLAMTVLHDLHQAGVEWSDVMDFAREQLDLFQAFRTTPDELDRWIGIAGRVVIYQYTSDVGILARVTPVE